MAAGTAAEAATDAGEAITYVRPASMKSSGDGGGDGSSGGDGRSDGGGNNSDKTRRGSRCAIVPPNLGERAPTQIATAVAAREADVLLVSKPLSVIFSFYPTLFGSSALDTGGTLVGAFAGQIWQLATVSPDEAVEDLAA